MVISRIDTRWLSLVSLVLVLVASPSPVLAQDQSLSPSNTVRSFYKTMREKKFREAFAMSIYRPAIDPLSRRSLKTCAPTLRGWRWQFRTGEHHGEQISGEIATVFLKVRDDETRTRPSQ